MGDRFPPIPEISDLMKGEKKTLGHVAGEVLYVEAWGVHYDGSYLSMNRNSFLSEAHP